MLSILNDSFISLSYELIEWCKRISGRFLMTQSVSHLRKTHAQLKKIIVRAGHWQKMVACNRKRLKINSKTIHCPSTHLTCKKEKPPVMGFGLTGTRAKYLCFWCRYGIHIYIYIHTYIHTYTLLMLPKWLFSSIEKKKYKYIN